MIEKLNKREIQLLKILSEHKGFVQTDDLCRRMDIKPRTLRECIRGFRDLYASAAGIDIEAGSGQGYRLSVRDQDRWFSLLKEMLDTEQKNQYLLPSDQNERISWLIRFLLTANDYVKPEDLMDQLFISRSTFAEDMKQVREQLSVFDVQVEAVSRQGLRITGDEFHIRNAIAEFCFEDREFDERKLQKKVSSYFADEEFVMVREILYDTLKKYNFSMADNSFRNLIIHILIAMNRIIDGTYIVSQPLTDSTELKEKKEWVIAEDLYDQLSRKTGLKFPESEIGYVTIHLLGKKMIESENEMILYPDTLNILSGIMKQIAARYSYDFSGDFELFGALAMHMEPLMERARYGLHISNPLQETISRENPVAFDIAVMAADALKERTGLKIDDNEIGYLAMHFALAIERLQKGLKKRILIVCASGAGTSRMLAYRIRRQFGNACEAVDTISYFDLMSAGRCDYDIVLSTVPLYFPLNVPVVRIKEIPDMDDMDKISSALNEDPEGFTFLSSCFDRDLIFRDADLSSQEEIIRFLAGKLSEKTRIDARFADLVLERENLASTAMGNLTAFPHSGQPVSDRTLVAVMSLKKPVEWGNRKVQLVFLTAVQKSGDKVFAAFSEAMAAILMEHGILNRLIKDLSYDQLISSLQEIYKRPDDNIFK
ncbi:MAG: BglG family transcription antiterminator [Solobacterium sp.]|nr:BglG family transcription antiterminator [Solobacterium sp.]